MEYRLENGQVDAYPAGWAIELEDLLNAMRGLLQTDDRPPGIT